MKKFNLHEIRQLYLDFFQKKGHLSKESYSLVPKNDKSLLLINAGMAPLKAFFLGKAEPPNKRMTTCQKCVRTGDIDNVGKTDRHGTFFEMLGNFSFGDYFKEEAIEWAWEFMTEKLEIPKEKLWVSVYFNDEESYKIWNEKIGLPKDRIVKLGKEDNFWELEVGPCGPSSEIYIDRGEKYSCGEENCKPGCECDRYVEVWNLVFSQYDKDEEGKYHNLPNPNIDTGMGLERITAIMNNSKNIFEIEPIKTIIKEVEKRASVEYGQNKKIDTSIRVITDHLRAMTFLVSDGVIPSNEGRGYVLRRLIRRASRHGKLLGIKKDFLNELVDVVINNWKNFYKELSERQNQIKKIIKIEEEKFQETVDQGIDILKNYIKDMKDNNRKTLEGVEAFKLYDTYGFPLDLTKEILEDEGLDVDESGFNDEMEKQRSRARKARESSDTLAWDSDNDINLGDNIKTQFEGYNNLTTETKILAIIKGNQLINSLDKGEEGYVILDNTPFYPEGGGQIGDKGTLKNEKNELQVNDTKKGSNNKILHLVKVIEGKINVEDIIEAKVDKRNRFDVARNHSATHLLHKALKEVVGEHVNQAGSLVTSDRLRFDFTHFESLSNEEINNIERRVNEQIFKALNVDVMEKTLDEAKDMGAMALFDEKYSDEVRIVKIGDYSMELCGGTHVNNISEIGIFKIISETGIASGVRRIEAITGRKLYEYIQNIESELNNVSIILKTNRNNLIERTESTVNEIKSLEKEIDRLKAKLASSKLDDMLNEVYNIDGINIITKKIDGMDMNSLRQMGDKIKEKENSMLIVLGTENNGKVNFIATATKDLVEKGIHCGNIIREVAKTTGGGGGGRPNMAQAGGKDPSKIDEALTKVKDIVKDQIDK